jgi:hypothetical protein
MQGVTSWGQGIGGGTAGTQQMTGAQSAAAAAAAAAIQQPTGAGPLMAAAAAYPMQQFQVCCWGFMWKENWLMDEYCIYTYIYIRRYIPFLFYHCRPSDVHYKHRLMMMQSTKI